VIVVALDTTSIHGSVALWRGGACLEVRPSDPERSYSSQLPRLLLDIAAAHGVALPDVDVLAAAIGPGSLTGLRVGIATVQGLAFALDRPVVGVSALEATARLAARRTAVFAPLVGAWNDAFRGEVFAALYVREPGRDTLVEIDGPSVDRPEATAQRWASLAADRELTIAGTAVGASAGTLEAAFANRVHAGQDVLLLAGVVAEIAADRAARDEAVLPHALQPLYVRRPDAELARERAAGTRPATSSSPAAR
jgi:tRNA threonylcarbamoyladenosine biosynthesis protein TsaB